MLDGSVIPYSAVIKNLGVRRKLSFAANNSAVIKMSSSSLRSVDFGLSALFFSMLEQDANCLLNVRIIF